MENGEREREREKKDERRAKERRRGDAGYETRPFNSILKLGRCHCLLKYELQPLLLLYLLLRSALLARAREGDIHRFICFRGSLPSVNWIYFVTPGYFYPSSKRALFPLYSSSSIFLMRKSFPLSRVDINSLPIDRPFLTRTYVRTYLYARIRASACARIYAAAVQ